MKTEKQIAQQNVNNWRKSSEDKFIRMYYYNCERHKASCQRFLEFLESDDMLDAKHSGNYDSELEVYEEKTTDLKQAISLYEKGGI